MIDIYLIIPFFFRSVYRIFLAHPSLRSGREHSRFRAHLAFRPSLPLIASLCSATDGATIPCANLLYSKI